MEYEKTSIKLESTITLHQTIGNKNIVRLAGKDASAKDVIAFTKTDDDGRFKGPNAGEIITIHHEKEAKKKIVADPYSGDNFKSSTTAIFKISSMILADSHDIEKFKINNSKNHTMENEKKSYNEATLSGGLVQLDKKTYQSQDGDKDYYQVGIKVNYKDKEDKVQSTYYNAVIPDKHKSMAESLKIGDNVSAKGFITKDEFQDGEIKHVRDKIILTQIDKIAEEKNEAKIKFTGVVVKEDAVVKQVENLGKTASLTVSQSVTDKKTDEKSYIYMEGKAVGKFADKLEGLKKGDVVQMEGALKLDKYESKDKTTKYEKMNIIVFDAKKIEKEKAETVSKNQEKVSAAPTEEKPKKASKGR